VTFLEKQKKMIGKKDKKKHKDWRHAFDVMGERSKEENQ
jgi:hypothetical protein